MNSAAATPWWLVGGISAASCDAAYAARNAIDLAASCINLNTPGTYDATIGAVPTWDGVRGWTGTGSAYLRTGMLVPNQPGQGRSVVLYIYIDPAGGTVTNNRFFGCSASSTTSYQLAIDTSASPSFITAANGGNGNYSLTDAISGLHTIAISGNRSFIDGVLSAKVINAWSGTNSYEILLLARNSSTGAGLFCSAYRSILAASFYNTILTDQQIAAVSAAMVTQC